MNLVTSGVYTIYMLRTNKDTLYVGITNNLEKRLQTHRHGKGAKYLRMFESFELVHEEKVKTRSDALKREIKLKKLSKKDKLKLISSP